MYSTNITFCIQHSYQLPCTTHSLSTTDITILCVHNNYIFCFVSCCCIQQLLIVSVCSMIAHFCVYNRCQFISTEWCCPLKLPTHSVIASLPSSEKTSCLSEAWKIMSKAQGNAKIQYIVWKVLGGTKYGHTTSDYEKCLPSWNHFFL